MTQPAGVSAGALRVHYYYKSQLNNDAVGRKNSNVGEKTVGNGKSIGKSTTTTSTTTSSGPPLLLSSTSTPPSSAVKKQQSSEEFWRPTQTVLIFDWDGILEYHRVFPQILSAPPLSAERIWMSVWSSLCGE